MEHLKEEVKKLRERLSSLELCIIEMEKISRFPQIGDTYWFVERGIIKEYEYNNDRLDQNAIKYEKIFSNKKDAEEHLDHKEMYMKLIRRIRVLNGGWVPDWNDRNSIKHLLCFDHHVNEFVNLSYALTQSQPDELCMYSENVCMTILKEFSTDDLKLALFGETHKEELLKNPLSESS